MSDGLLHTAEKLERDAEALRRAAETPPAGPPGFTPYFDGRAIVTPADGKPGEADPERIARIMAGADEHRASCDIWQARPRVWRSRWDWLPPGSGEPDAATYHALIRGEAARLLKLYDAHERVCPVAARDWRREQGFDLEPCPVVDGLREWVHDNLHGDLVDGGGIRLRPDDEDEPADIFARHGIDFSPTAVLGLRRLSEIAPTAPGRMVLGYLAHGHTILYGDGGIGKGTLTARWIADATAAGHAVLVVDYEAHEDEWSYRVHKLGGDTERVGYICPTTVGWPGAIWEHAGRLVETAESMQACIVVVDSIVQACVGADPMDPETASRYGAAVMQLGRPVLSLAHVTKTGEARWPFGTVFWHNLARVTWNLSRAQGGVLLSCKKANAYSKPHRQLVSIVYHEGSLDVGWKPYEEALLDTVLRVLDDAPGKSPGLPLDTIVRLVDEERDDEDEPVKLESVRRALKRASTGINPVVQMDGELWKRR